MLNKKKSDKKIYKRKTVDKQWGVKKSGSVYPVKGKWNSSVWSKTEVWIGTNESLCVWRKIQRSLVRDKITDITGSVL